MNVRSALFLDLDGTVRRSKSGKTFIEGPDDVEIIPGMKELIYHYRLKKSWLVYGITNQGGVAHGFKTERAVQKEFDAMIDLLRDHDDSEPAPFHHIFYCPYDEKGTVPPFNRKSLSRKPMIGMLVAAEEHAFNFYGGIYIDWNTSLLVGDRPEDEQCAKNAGIPFMWASDFLKTETL